MKKIREDNQFYDNVISRKIKKIFLTNAVDDLSTLCKIRRFVPKTLSQWIFFIILCSATEIDARELDINFFFFLNKVLW